MGWKCAPQVMGLVRDEPKPGLKHRANGLKIAMEAGHERASLSDTLDRTRSHLNEYIGYKSGEEFWKTMEDEASDYRVQVKGKTRTGEEIIRTKGLQKNAVIGWAVIYNPPANICENWNREQYQQFFKDCRDSMAEISSIFRQENRRMSVIHWDEGVSPQDTKQPVGHVHDLGICKNDEGRYCGNLIDAKLLNKINTEFPRMMRERGWDIDDLDLTDFDKAKHDEVYREERKAKRKLSGLSVNDHIKRKTKQTAQEAKQLLEDTNRIHKEAEDMRQQIGREQIVAQHQIQKERDELEKEIEKKTSELEEKQSQIYELETILQSDAQRLKKAIEEFETIRSQDTDMSRKSFMEHLHGKNSKTAEEMYQNHIQAMAAKREETLSKLEAIANQYSQKHDMFDVRSVDRQKGEI